MKKRFYKSRENKMLEGVCGGLAEYFAIDPTLVRLGWVLLSRFPSKAEDVDYMTQETGLPKEECVSAYDFITGLAISEWGKKNE